MRYQLDALSITYLHREEVECDRCGASTLIPLKDRSGKFCTFNCWNQSITELKERVDGWIHRAAMDGRSTRPTGGPSSPISGHCPTSTQPSRREVAQ